VIFTDIFRVEVCCVVFWYGHIMGFPHLPVCLCDHLRPIYALKLKTIRCRKSLRSEWYFSLQEYRCPDFSSEEQRSGLGNSNCTVGHKNVPLYFCPYLYQLLTNFQNSFTGTLCRQFAIKWLLHIPPHSKCVFYTTLWNINVSKNEW